MSSSYPENIHRIIHLIAEARPKSVLDIGMGNGKYGFLIREYFYPRTNPNAWPHVERVDGFDVFWGYIKPHHKCCYDSFDFGNALETKFKPYDLYLLIDVIEHWPKEEAHKLISHLLTMGKVLISTPQVVEEQSSEENKWEAHISQWSATDFDGYPVIKSKSEGSPSFIYLLGK